MKKLFALIVISLIFFSACTKTVTDSSTPLAVYSLGNGSGCTGATVSGRYVADTALTGDNNVTIMVDVGVAGPYWISTNTVNGMTFSQTSTFIDTGRQTVVLTGYGIPVAIDTSTFMLTALNGLGDSCTFSVATVQGVLPNYYLTCFLDGVYRNFGDSASATNSSIPGISGAPGLDISGQDTVINSTSKIDFGVSNPASIAPGTYNDTSIVKAYFNYTDSLAETWSVNTTTQPSFTIVVTNANDKYVQGTFSGMIRNQQGAGLDSIAVTNGSFTVPVK